MIVMPANNRGMVVGWLAGRFPGRIGHLYSPGSMAAVYPWLPYALDNGRFSVWATGAEWSEFDYIALLDRASGNSVQPTWALVPDVVADRDGTLREWEQWSHRIRDGYGWKLEMEPTRQLAMRAGPEWMLTCQMHKQWAFEGGGGQ